MYEMFDLGFRNKLCEILLIIMGVIFVIGAVYSNMVLAYIFTFSFLTFILLLTLPFDKFKQN
jgi:hypothetical protein